MKKSLSVDLLLYGGMLIVLSILAQRLSCSPSGATLWIGLAGGASSLLLGVLGLLNYQVRRWAIGAMACLSILLLTQTVLGWLAVKAGVESEKFPAMIQSLLSLFAVGQLVNIIQNRSGLVP